MSFKKEPQLTSEEIKIQEIAQKAYDDALKFFYYPTLPDPNFIFDYSKDTGFFIDLETYRITLNLANTHDIVLSKEYYDFFFSLSIHELSHYIFCPYDNFTNMQLLNTVLDTKIYVYYVPIIVNIFSDLIIDSKNHQHFPKIMEWELQKHISFNNKPEQFKQASKLWKILIHSYELLWNKNFLPNSIIDPIEHEITKKICNAIQDSIDREEKWHKNLKKIANLLKPILKEECSIKERIQYNSNSKNSNQSDSETFGGIIENPLQIPEDVQSTFGDFTQNIDFDQVKTEASSDGQESQKKEPSIKENLENFAKNQSFGRFNAIAQLYGVTDSIEKLAIWYRSHAKNLIKIEIVTHKQGGSIPISVEKWRIGDPIEKLDVIQSLISSPIFIPNITTKKWNYKLGTGIEINEQLPDLMIVLDSSGSMGWNFSRNKISGEFHLALLASFAALYYAIMHGSYVSVINFSEKARYLEWSNNIYDLEKILLDYQGSGTILPSNKIVKIVKKAIAPCCVLIITDFEISNWDQAYHEFLSILQMGNMLICFFINGREEELSNPEFRNLQDMGAKFYCIAKVNDLIGLVIKEIRNIYKK
ncbi:MAG: hypothetical protein K9W44_07165 [Candidatus Lokiarchaeota archaeon]|nr:hypothetical protein [Candidatus Harpocratesius repetitus]